MTKVNEKPFLNNLILVQSKLSSFFLQRIDFSWFCKNLVFSFYPEKCDFTVYPRAEGRGRGRGLAFLGSTGQIFFFALSFHILNSFWIQQVGVLCLLFYFFTHIPISYQYLAFLGSTGHYLDI